MTPFLRFFVLALTPLLGVTGSFGPAFFFGLVVTVLLASTATLVHTARNSLSSQGLLWSTLGLSVGLVTVVDLVTTLTMPGLRSAWGIYLNLLAFSPLVAVLPLNRAPASDLGTSLTDALKEGLLLTALLAGTGLLRESLGRGSLTLAPDLASWKIPFVSDFPFTLLSTGAGGFFLAAVAVVVYRTLRPRMQAWNGPMSSEEAEVAPQRPTPAPVTPALEPLEEWGESLVDVAAALPGLGVEKRRILVIGSGNGELAYYLAMLCLEASKTDTPFAFRVRGVDHFSTRIETAIRGSYRESQIEFIPEGLKKAWMTKGSGDEKYFWKVAQEPRLHVQFEVADFQQGQVFFPQPCHLIVLNQGIEYVNDQKKAQLLATVCSHLVSGGALVVTGEFGREFLPEGMKRTGTTVFRRT